MTYAQALMIIRNPKTYSVDRVRKAAIFVIGTLGASSEDLMQAKSLL